MQQEGYRNSLAPSADSQETIPAGNIAVHLVQTIITFEPIVSCYFKFLTFAEFLRFLENLSHPERDDKSCHLLQVAQDYIFGYSVVGRQSLCWPLGCTELPKRFLAFWLLENFASSCRCHNIAHHHHLLMFIPAAFTTCCSVKGFS